MADFALSDNRSGTRDTRPGMIVCAFDQERPDWDLVEDLSGRLWNPPGARTVVVGFDQPIPLAQTLHDGLATPGVRGLLLIGVAEEGNTALIPLRAWNRSADGDSRALADGPGVLRATVPAADMIRALSQVGVTARVDPEGATGTGGYLLYHVLASVPDQVLAPSVGLLLLPPGMEGQAMREAVKAAAAAMGASLAPLPRQSFG